MNDIERYIMDEAMVIAGYCLSNPNKLDISDVFEWLGIKHYVNEVYLHSLKLLQNIHESSPFQEAPLELHLKIFIVVD